MRGIDKALLVLAAVSATADAPSAIATMKEVVEEAVVWVSNIVDNDFEDMPERDAGLEALADIDRELRDCSNAAAEAQRIASEVRSSFRRARNAADALPALPAEVDRDRRRWVEQALNAVQAADREDAEVANLQKSAQRLVATARARYRSGESVDDIAAEVHQAARAIRLGKAKLVESDRLADQSRENLLLLLKKYGENARRKRQRTSRRRR